MKLNLKFNILIYKISCLNNHMQYPWLLLYIIMENYVGPIIIYLKNYDQIHKYDVFLIDIDVSKNI